MSALKSIITLTVAGVATMMLGAACGPNTGGGGGGGGGGGSGKKCADYKSLETCNPVNKCTWDNVKKCIDVVAGKKTCSDKGKCVFVSSENTSGNISLVNDDEKLTGKFAADAKCNLWAESANKCGGQGQVECNFKAWLCSEGKGPADSWKTDGKNAYVLVDGSLVADDWAKLTSGTLSHPIDLTEKGDTLAPVVGSQDSNVWTGLLADGKCTKPSDFTWTCRDWKYDGWNVTAAGGVGYIGYLTSQDGKWTKTDALGPIANTDGAAYCSHNYHLYCIEQQ